MRGIIAWITDLFIIAWILFTSADFVVVGLCPWFSACLPVGLSVCQLAGLLSVPLSITCVYVRWWGLLMAASGFAASIVFDVGRHQLQ